MRIALVTHYYPAHRGGIELVAGELARRLAGSHGASIDWHASDCDPPPALEGVSVTPAASCNLFERRFGFPYPLWSPSALRGLVRTARRADVVHLHDCLYLPNMVAYAAARLAGRPVVVTQHVGMVPYRSALLRALQFMAYRTLGRWVLGGARQVVFVSESVLHYFAGFVRFAAPPLRVANGVDTAVFHPADAAARADARAQLGIGADEPLLLFVGRFVEKKGLPLLQQLAQRLPEARWKFAGWGSLDPSAWALSNVEVLHGRSGAALAQLYRAADLLVLPSTGEGFPLVVQEAMACGTPALVGSETAAGCPEAGDLLFAEPVEGPGAAARWEARLRALIAEGGLAACRGAVAAFAREQWSWERCARTYAGLLRPGSSA
jgi:glycosyltransferase involved in cell wall biosynthesis